MAYDSLVLSAVIKELSRSLIGARIEKIHQPSKTDIIIVFHSPKGKSKLVLSADARMARVHLTTHNRENPLTPPLFCMVLRKHLEGGRITRIEHPGFERIVHFYIQAIDELGRLSEKVLVCEIMGKHSNIILIDEDKTILDAVTRFSHAVNRYREVLPGKVYIDPPEQGKLNPMTATEAQFKELLWEKALSGTGISVEKWLLNSYTGLSPQSCKEIAFRSGYGSGFNLQNLGDYDLHRVWETFASVLDSLRNEQNEPTIVFNEYKDPLAFSAINLQIFGDAITRHDTMNEVLDLFYHLKAQKYLFDQAKDHLIKVVTEELNRNYKKLAIQEDTIARADEAEQFRLIGEVITANLHQLKPYQKDVKLVNFYDPDQKEIEIELDPSLSPAQNAQSFFKKYNKAKAGKQNALELKEKITEEITYLETVAANIDQSITLSDLQEIKLELVEGRYVREKQKTGRRKVTQQEETQPLQFAAPDGSTIWVGKNNKQNDLLTLKKAKANDLWLHVKDIPGSHVIIKCDQEDIPETTLLQAAQLAAYFSKARNSSKVPVDYTRKKHVHKPNGAKPGMVIYENQQTIFVDPPQSLAGFQQQT